MQVPERTKLPESCNDFTKSSVCSALIVWQHCLCLTQMELPTGMKWPFLGRVSPTAAHPNLHVFTSHWLMRKYMSLLCWHSTRFPFVSDLCVADGHQLGSYWGDSLVCCSVSAWYTSYVSLGLLLMGSDGAECPFPALGPAWRWGVVIVLGDQIGIWRFLVLGQNVCILLLCFKCSSSPDRTWCLAEWYIW